jgi:histidine triad (HIT) family protein
MPPQHGDQCIFCQLINSPQQLKLVGETDNFYAWLDINPRARGYTMVVPKEHIESIMEFDPGMYEEGMVLAREVVEKAKRGLGADGATITVHVDEVGGQMMDHAYIQVFPRFEDDENAGTPASAMFQPIEMSEDELDETADKMHSVDVDFDVEHVEPHPDSQRFKESETGSEDEESSSEGAEEEEGDEVGSHGRGQKGQSYSWD